MEAFPLPRHPRRDQGRISEKLVSMEEDIGN